MLGKIGLVNADSESAAIKIQITLGFFIEISLSDLLTGENYFTACAPVT